MPLAGLRALEAVASFFAVDAALVPRGREAGPRFWGSFEAEAFYESSMSSSSGLSLDFLEALALVCLADSAGVGLSLGAALAGEATGFLKRVVWMLLVGVPVDVCFLPSRLMKKSSRL